jgi:hypothetical protein
MFFCEFYVYIQKKRRGNSASSVNYSFKKGESMNFLRGNYHTASGFTSLADYSITNTLRTSL